MFDNSWVNTIILSGCFLALFGTAEMLYHLSKWKGEVTRKIVHVGTGFLTMLFPLLLTEVIQVALLCGSFALILGSSLRFGWLKSINDINRQSHGSMLYPAIVLIVFIIAHTQNNDSYFFLPILTMAICDPIAALAGKRFPIRTYPTFGGQKSLGGNLGFFTASVLLSFVVLSMIGYTSISFLMIVSIALLATIAEALSGKGWDNFTIPLSVLIVLYWFQ